MNDKTFLNSFLALSEPITWATLGILAICFYLLWVLQKKNFSFSLRMFVALFVGLAFGFVLQAIAGYPDQNQMKNILWLVEIKTWFSFFGKAFVSFIKMLVVPIILFSLIRIILRIDNGVNLKALLGRSVFWLLFTTAIAASVGIFLAVNFGLGQNLQSISDGAEIRNVKTFTDVLLGIIPDNPVFAMSSDNIIAVVVFTFFVGFGARAIAKNKEFEKISKTLDNIIEAGYQIVMWMTLFIIRFMPYAVICLMANTLISNGFGAIRGAILFVGLIYLAMVVMLVIHLLLIALHGLNPWIYLKKSLNTYLLAFTSRSSMAMLPLSISTLTDKLGVNAGTANFTASLGSTVGLNGCAGYFPAMTAVFIANILGVPIDFSFMVMVVIVAILGSLGIAGVPGVATMAASIMLAGIGFGEHFGLLAIVLAIDPILDMARTLSNVSGAMTSAVCADKELGTLNKEIYNG
ncbi:cation:dicarboxylate symporter family transporter [Helicobacter cappadocius]|uniref:Cation:dicarboxylase symporter family transporter n=1 Tax=Helicobacter cappadocius TaxID=3063998 RepID=A0AA90PKE7_9HELI|nr:MULTISPECIES: cation:dicarboxylase symporter family transporter [unclassified Helicobacter]MDO7253095.1 cation:dicarboxylase symporter family transporter [Helicobacter sp. faydin-H75]MDP2538779.1 cation:dicarboxylase symporter family transporter [Helicobacter sp. faydin-H76]